MDVEDPPSLAEPFNAYRLAHPVQQEQIAGIIRELEALRDGTNPRSGEASAAGKDDKAYLALQLAGHLVDRLAGWAINHQIGLARTNKTFIGTGPTELSKHPGYLAHMKEVDSHRHERSGAIWREGDTADTTPDVLRLMIHNILAPMKLDLLPDRCGVELIPALVALNTGDRLPLFDPTPNDDQHKHQETELTLQAIGFVAFLRAFKKSSIAEARKEVATAYGLSAATIASWETRLKQGNELRVEREEQWAKNAAANLREAKSEHFASGSIVPFAEPAWATQYSEVAMHQAGREFMALRANRKARRRRA